RTMYSDQIVQSHEFVQEWLLCGPFPGAPGNTLASADTSFKAMNFDYLESIGGEPRAIPAIDTQVELPAFKTVRHWFFHQQSASELNFKSIFGGQSSPVVYAFFRVKSSHGRPAQLVVAGSAGLKIFLNGAVITTAPKLDLIAGAPVGIPITFKPGKNNLLFKFEQNASDYWCRVHFRG
ncbi:hypothetical protein L0128_12260, partial [candidate division KSB1 bacterium]|nr:hypothetical protein [candidate division KSB1 bacterium]